MAYGRSNTDSFVEGFSLSPLPYPVLLVLALLAVFFWMSWPSSYWSVVEEAEWQINWLLLLTLIGLLLLLKGLSFIDPDWLMWMSRGERRRTYYEPSEGSSPWGVAAVIVLLLVVLHFRSRFRESWYM